MTSSQSPSEHFDDPELTIRLLVERLRIAEANEGKLALEVKMLRSELVRLEEVHRQKIAAILNHADPRMPPPLESLSADQQEIIRSLQGLAPDELVIAETLLASLEGQPVSAELTKNLTHILTVKKWSVVCPKCKAPAWPHWFASTRYKRTGGQLRIAHKANESEGGKYVQHVCTTRMPHFALVKRVDGRSADASSE